MNLRGSILWTTLVLKAQELKLPDSCLCDLPLSPPREGLLISRSHLWNQKKEKQVRKELQTWSQAAKPNSEHPVDLPKMQVEQEGAMWREKQGSSSRTPPVPLHTISLPAPRSVLCKVMWLNWSSHRRLCFTSMGGHHCPYSSDPSLNPQSRTTTPGYISAAGPNRDVKLWTEPPPSPGQGCPVTRGWKCPGWIHKEAHQRPVTASPPVPPKQCGTTSPLTPKAIPRTATRWRLPWWRATGTGWRDAAIPQQSQTLTSSCLLRNPTFEELVKTNWSTASLQQVEQTEHLNFSTVVVFITLKWTPSSDTKALVSLGAFCYLEHHMKCNLLAKVDMEQKVKVCLSFCLVLNAIKVKWISP